MVIHSDSAVAPPGVLLGPKSLNSQTLSSNGDVLQKNDSAYVVKDQWHSQAKHLRMIHVGAGAAGLLMAYKMKKEFEDYSLVCYEKYS
jgi:hypothetical protein